MATLILAEEDDPCADHMIEVFRERGVPVDRVDLAWFPRALGLEARLRDGRWTGCLYAHERRIDLEAVSAIWYRSPAAFRFPHGLTSAERSHAAIEAKMGIGGVLLSLPALRVNRPDLAATATYKPLQLAAAAAVGLVVADTIVTSRPDPIGPFVAENLDTGGTVTKMFASNSIVEDGARSVAFTRAVHPRDLADLRGIEVTAHQFQARVEPKAHDARGIVVGDRLFGFAIHAATTEARLDFRSDYTALRYDQIDIPASVEAGIQALTRDLGLLYAAVDFVVRPDDGWVFIGDVNPGGQYAWLEAATGAPITDTLAELLISASAPFAKVG